MISEIVADKRSINHHILLGLIEQFTIQKDQVSTKAFFELAKTTRYIDTLLYTKAINAAVQLEDSQFGIDVFTSALKNDAFLIGVNSITCNKLLALLNKHKKSHFVLDFFETLQHQKLVDKYTRTEALKAAILLDKIDIASKIFQDACNSQQVDLIVLQVMLNAAEQSKDPTTLQAIFERAEMLEKKEHQKDIYLSIILTGVRTRNNAIVQKVLQQYTLIKNYGGMSFNHHLLSIYVAIIVEAGHQCNKAGGEVAYAIFKIAIADTRLNGSKRALLFNSAISALARCHFPTQIIDDIFAQACQLKLDDRYTYANYIFAMCQYHEPKKADDALKQAEERNKTDEVVYNSRAAMPCVDCNEFASILSIFKRQKSLNQVNDVSYATIINQAWRYNQPEHAKDLFNESIECQVASNSTYTTTITGYTNYFQGEGLPYSRNIFQMARDKQTEGKIKISVELCNVMLLAEGKESINIEKVMTFFQEMRDQSLTNADSYALIMDICYKQKEFMLAARFFEEAQAMHTTNIVQYSIMAKVISSAYDVNFPTLKELFDQTESTNIQTIGFLEHIIVAVGNAAQYDVTNNSIDLAIKALKKISTFEPSKEEYTIALNAMIVTSGKCQRFNLAQQYYKEAQQKQLADKITYTSIIAADNNCGPWKELDIELTAFKKAKSSKNIDSVLYHTMMIVAAKCYDVGIVDDIFRSMKTQKIANRGTYTVYIRAQAILTILTV